jgi:hypothetical protein
MQTIELSENSLSGSIPSEIGGMVALTRVHLRDNQFNGSIPSEFGLLLRLNNLELDTNDLTGLVPWEIGLLFFLVHSTFHRNDFTGGFEDLFCDLIPVDFTADCLGSVPEVFCLCCTTCCEDGEDCEFPSPAN